MPVIGHSAFLQSLGWAILNSLWQMAFLWVMFQVVISIYHKTGSPQKSRLASIFLCTGFLWFLYTLISHSIAGANAGNLISASYQQIKGYAAMDEWLHNTLPAASIIYLILLILPILRFIRNYQFVQQLRNKGLKKINVDWRIFVNKVAAQMGIKKHVQIWISELITSPVTIGYIKPIILIPMAAINHLNPQQMEAVLLHELSHIRRFDYLINLFVNFIQTILYYNPFVNLFVKFIEKEREKSCDEAVIQYQYDPQGYAAALLILQKTKLEQNVMAMAAAGKKNDLISRVEIILGVERSANYSFNKITGIFASLLCIIALNAIFIFSKPEKNNKGSLTFNQITNPYYFIAGKTGSGDEEFQNDEEQNVSTEINNHVFVNTGVNKTIDLPPFPATPPPVNEKPNKEIQNNPEQFNSKSVLSPAFISQFPEGAIPVNLVSVIETHLSQKEVEQVKEAVEASKIVLEKAQWKLIENNIADVMTYAEKQKIKVGYLQEVDKINWKQLEERLKQSYFQTNWDEVNDKLNSAIAGYRLDSLEQSLKATINSIVEIEKFVIKNQSQELIHPELSLESLRDKKLQVKETLDRVKAIRNKKIIQL